MKMPVFSDPRDYLALAVRRKWWILVSFILISSLVAAVVLSMPDIYVSEATVLVQPRDVPDDFVRDLVRVTAEERINVVRQTILSRRNLLQIVTEFQDKLPELRSMTDQEKVEVMRSRIQIVAEALPTQVQQSNSDVSYFRIAYEDENPGVAQQVTSRLTARFIEEDNRARAEKVSGTKDFIASELARVSSELEGVSEDYRAMQERYRYELPEQLPNSQRALDRLQLQLQANQEAVADLMATRRTLERQLSETEPVLVERISDLRQSLRREPPSPLVQDYRQKESEYQELLTRYTPRHPAVLQAEAELEALREQIPPEDLLDLDEPTLAEDQTVTRPNPAYQQLQEQLDEVRADIENRRREREQIESEIAEYQRRIRNTPAREQEMAEITRRYEDLRLEYDDLQNKLREAELSQSLESRAQGSQFIVLDSASYPTEPAKPERLKVILMGLVFGIAFGVAVAFGVDLADQKFWTYSEVENLLGAPVLAEIPVIVSKEDERRERRRHILTIAASFIALTGLAAFVYLLYSEPGLRGALVARLNSLGGWIMR